MLGEVIEPVIVGDFDICMDSIQVQRIKNRFTTLMAKLIKIGKLTEKDAPESFLNFHFRVFFD